MSVQSISLNSCQNMFDSGSTKDIAETIDNAIMVGMRDVVISKVRTMYNNNVLTNTHIIRLLEDKLKFEIEVN